MAANILFVDDTPDILSGLKRMLRTRRLGWNVVTADSGAQALEKLKKGPFDLIVTDVRMPEMDGTQLLEHVLKISPRTIRIVLSGYMETQSILQLAASAHQYLAKPCGNDLLVETILEALALADILPSSYWRKVVAGLTGLPCAPERHDELLHQLVQETPSNSEVARIISQDAGMSAGLLKLTNSGFFTTRRGQLFSLEEAVSIIGIDVLKHLILEKDYFKPLADMPSRTNTQPSDVAGLEAGYIAQFTDVGRLIIAHEQQTSEQSLNLSEREHAPPHAQIGAYCLGLWCFSPAIVSAILSQSDSEKQNGPHGMNGTLESVMGGVK